MEKLVPEAGTRRFATAELRAAQRELLLDGKAVALGARAFDVLLELVRRQGSVATKSQILAAAWPIGVVVEDNNLQVQISALRKILGPDTIATVAGRGYQLVIRPGIVFTADTEQARGPAALMPHAASVDPLLAVLPFDNLSNDAEMQFFSDGVSEEILERLSRGARLKVVGRTSSFQFRAGRKSDAARALNCTHILDGAVRRAGDAIRLSVHLVEAASQTTLWSRRFDRSLEDIFSVQDEVAESIANALNRTFSISATRTVDPVVHDLYLRGIRPAITPGEMQTRIEVLETVSQRAPHFADAWGKLAEQRAHLRLIRPYAERDSIAETVAVEAHRALALDPHNPAARLAQYLLLPPWGRFVEAEAAIDRLTQNAGPAGYWLYYAALHLQSVGRMREALEISRRSYELDALNPFVANGLGLGLWYGGHTNEARASFEDTLARWPDMHATANNLIMLCADTNDWSMVDALLAPARLAKHPLRQFEQGARGYVAAVRDASPRARRRAIASARALFENSGFALYLLTVIAQLGAQDDAFAIADASNFWPSHDNDDVMGIDAYRTYFLFHAAYPNLRADPRFVRLCARLGLVHYWTTTKNWPDCVDEVPYDFKDECMKFASRRLTPVADPPAGPRSA